MQFNNSAWDASDKRREVIRELLHPDSKDKAIFIGLYTYLNTLSDLKITSSLYKQNHPFEQIMDTSMLIAIYL